MEIQNVYAADKPKTAEVQKSEEFKGHYVVEGKVVRTWGESAKGLTYFWATDLKSLQKEYDAEKGIAAKKDEAYTWKTPFTFVGGIFSSVFSFIGDMFKSIFSICGYGEKADKAENTENKEKDAPKKT